MINLPLPSHVPVFFLPVQTEKGASAVIKKRNNRFDIFFGISCMIRAPGINSGAKSCDNYIQRFIRNYIL
jgi:hypothetical protein